MPISSSMLKVRVIQYSGVGFNTARFIGAKSAQKLIWLCAKTFAIIFRYLWCEARPLRRWNQQATLSGLGSEGSGPVAGYPPTRLFCVKRVSLLAMVRARCSPLIVVKRNHVLLQNVLKRPSVGSLTPSIRPGMRCSALRQVN